MKLCVFISPKSRNEDCNEVVCIGPKFIHKVTRFGEGSRSLSLWVLFRPKSRSAASIILRGANDFMCDEMERSVHDALCVVRRVLESKTVVVGGGAVEAALSIYLENFATSLVSQLLE